MCEDLIERLQSAFEQAVEADKDEEVQRLHAEKVAHFIARTDAEAEVKALRAEVGRLQTKAAGAVDAARGYQRELAAEYARAERLAEAINAVLTDMSEWGKPAKGAHILRVINFLSMVLHPTAAQENDDV